MCQFLEAASKMEASPKSEWKGIADDLPARSPGLLVAENPNPQKCHWTVPLHSTVRMSRLKRLLCKRREKLLFQKVSERVATRTLK
jgi:hypothetical protein